MNITINHVPEKAFQGSVTALASLSYPEVKSVYEDMHSQDVRVVFDTLRPIGDEIWNFMNGERTVGEIAEALCFEFDIQVEARSFFPMIEGLIKDELVKLK